MFKGNFEAVGLTGRPEFSAALEAHRQAQHDAGGTDDVVAYGKDGVAITGDKWGR